MANATFKKACVNPFATNKWMTHNRVHHVEKCLKVQICTTQIQYARYILVNFVMVWNRNMDMFFFYNVMVQNEFGHHVPYASDLPIKTW